MISTRGGSPFVEQVFVPEILLVLLQRAVLMKAPK